MRRVIDRLRREFPGRWRYDRRFRVWIDDAHLRQAVPVGPLLDDGFDAFAEAEIRVYEPARWAEVGGEQEYVGSLRMTGCDLWGQPSTDPLPRPLRGGRASRRP